MPVIDGKISMATALAKRTVVFGDGLCPVCEFDPESADHLLVRCTVAKTVWWWICV
ncbi:putative reverse transcriptase zinc-binding domain-containing protein [Helianthus annuus]|nr:putative reverse transcriptase zinc-binding domain-containing protein [Helianthus annuus]